MKLRGSCRRVLRQEIEVSCISDISILRVRRVLINSNLRRVRRIFNRIHRFLMRSWSWIVWKFQKMVVILSSRRTFKLYSRCLSGIKVSKNSCPYDVYTYILQIHPHNLDLPFNNEYGLLLPQCGFFPSKNIAKYIAPFCYLALKVVSP